jgi:hypothetical protein
LVRDVVKEKIKEEERKLAQKGLMVDPAQRQEVENSAIKTTSLICIGFMIIGALFIIFGLVIKKMPVAATIISLVLFIAYIAICGVFSPDTWYQGLIWKVLVVVALIQAIQAAVAYQKEQNAVRDLEPEYE